MEYFAQIMWFVSWPVAIIISYKLASYVLKKKDLI